MWESEERAYFYFFQVIRVAALNSYSFWFKYIRMVYSISDSLNFPGTNDINMMKKVKFDFEVVIDKGRLKPVRIVSRIRIRDGNKEFVIGFSKKD